MSIHLKTLITLVPLPLRDRHRHTWHKIQLEIRTIIGKITRRIARPPFPQLEDGLANLHLGCGLINHPKFINIDGLPAPHVHYVRAIDNLSIFADETVDLIYASHCLEHFRYSQVPTVLSEWFRVLKAGGKLRLSVPDFDLLLKIYSNNGNDICSIEPILLGGQDYKYNFHYAVFNKSYLVKQLENIGFSKIYEWHPGIDELTVTNDYSNAKAELNGNYYPISLNLEAKK